MDELAFKDRRCSTCIMWHRLTVEPLKGQCRRFPPQLIQYTQFNDEGSSTWPETYGTEICGEHTAGGSGQISQLKRR